MMSKVVLPIEVRIASSHDSFAGQEARVSVIWVQSITLPGIVSEYNLRLQLADHLGHFTPDGQAAVELSIDIAEKPNLARTISSQPVSRFALLILAPQGERIHVCIDVPSPLGTIGTYEMMDSAAISGPLGE